MALSHSPVFVEPRGPIVIGCLAQLPTTRMAQEVPVTSAGGDKVFGNGATNQVTDGTLEANADVEHGFDERRDCRGGDWAWSATFQIAQ